MSEELVCAISVSAAAVANWRGFHESWAGWQTAEQTQCAR